VGDLERTQNSAANRARQLWAEILNTRDALAASLLPAMADTLESLGGAGGLTDRLRDVRDWLKNNGAVVTQWANVFKAAVVFAWEVFENFGQTVFNVGRIIGSMLKGVYGIITGNADMVRDATREMGDAWTGIKDGVKETADAFKNLQLESTIVWDQMEAGANRVAAAVSGSSGSGEGIVKPVENATIAVIEWGEQTIDTLTETATAYRKHSNEWAGALSGVLSAFTDSLADSLKNGMDAFRAFADFAIQQLLRIAAQAVVLKALTHFFAPTSFIGSLLGLPGRAGGGPVHAGRPYMVGERGPELFVPTQSGSIQANGGSVAGGGDTVVNLTLVTPDGRTLADQLTYRQKRDERMGRSIRIPLPMGAT
jgi:hypothetical protein